MQAGSKVHASRTILSKVRMRKAYVAHISKIHLVHLRILQLLGKSSLKFQRGILVVINMFIEYET